MCTDPRATTLALLGALATTGLSSCGSGEVSETNASPTLPTERHSTRGAADLPPASFEPVPDAMGLDFVHTDGADGRKLLPETMGSGGCLFDADGDGDDDLYLVNGRAWEGDAASPGRLYLFENGRFSDSTEAAGLAGHTVIGQGAVAADVDGDGDEDLFVTTLGPNLLFRNDGGTFVEVGAAAGVAGRTWTDDAGMAHAEWSTGATIADLDGDGWLDLFVCNYLEWSIETNVDFILTGDIKGYANPRLYKGSTCRLYRNLGDGTFEEVTETSGVLSAEHKALAVTTLDVDDDGLLDLFVANDTQPNVLFRNLGGMRFEDIGRTAGVGYGADGEVRAGMGVDVATYAAEGELAIAVGNFSDEPVSFFRSRSSQRVLYSDDNRAVGLSRSTGPSLTFDVAWLDANLDGWQDLLLLNGHLEPDIAEASATATWRQRPQLFLGLGERGRLVDATDDAGPAFAAPIVGRSLLPADLDGDGDLDVIATQCGGPVQVWRNTTPDPGRALRIDLVGPAPNPRAVGARVHVTGGPVAQTTWVRAGSGYLRQTAQELTFGAGEAKALDVTVRWPDGTMTSHPGLTPGSPHRLVHPAVD